MVPGESCVSYIVEGMIEYLMSCSDDLSQLIKQKIIFKIIPMMNPDGVILGNTQSDVMG